MSVVWSVKIAGVERECRIGSLNIQEVAVGINTMRATFFSAAGAFRPTVGAEIVITRDSVRVYGGFVNKTSETGASNQPLADIETLVDAVDFNSIAERRFVYETIAAGSTLKDALIQLDPYYSPYSVTLSGSQANGPTFDADIVFDGETLLEAFARLCQNTEFVGGIDYNRVLRMVQFGDLTAPTDATDDDDHLSHVGDIQVERSRTKYFNRVVLKYGKAGPLIPKSDSFTGNGVLATFPLTYPIAGPYAPTADEMGAVAYGVVNYADGTTESIAGQLAPSGFLWEYDPDAQTITRRSGAVPNLVAFTFRYDVQFPRTVIVEDAAEILANGLFETVVIYENVWDVYEATALAESHLSQFLEILTTIKWVTDTPGVHPTQTITLVEEERGVALGSYLITEVGPVNPADMQDLRYTVTAIDSQSFRGSFRQLYRDWLSPGSKNASTGAAAASTAGAPAPPDYSVQRNAGGAFGGSEFALLDPDRTGDTYGVGPDQHTAAFGVATGTAGILALFNKVIGKTKALSFTQSNTGVFAISKAGTATALNLINYDNDINLNADSIGLTVNDKASDYIRLIGLAESQGLMPVCRRVTSSYTVDSTIGSGGVLDFAIFGSGTLTVTLPALTSSTVLAGTVYRRMLMVRNIGTGLLTIDADSSETIDGALTLILQPGQSVLLQALTGTDAGWYSIGSSGGGGIQSKTVTLTDAQIKALGTPAPITIIAAPAAGYWNRVIAGSLHLNNSAGAYANVTAASGDLTIQSADGNWLLSNVANDTSLTVPLTRLTTYLTTAANTLVHLPPYFENIQYGGPGDWGYGQPVVTYPVPGSPQAVVLGMTNAAGALTGGHASNTLKVTLYYAVEAI